MRVPSEDLHRTQAKYSVGPCAPEHLQQRVRLLLVLYRNQNRAAQAVHLSTGHVIVKDLASRKELVNWGHRLCKHWISGPSLDVPPWVLVMAAAAATAIVVDDVFQFMMVVAA